MVEICRKEFTGVPMLESDDYIVGNEIGYSATFTRSAYRYFTFYNFINNYVGIMGRELYIR